MMKSASPTAGPDGVMGSPPSNWPSPRIVHASSWPRALSEDSARPIADQPTPDLPLAQPASRHSRHGTPIGTPLGRHLTPMGRHATPIGPAALPCTFGTPKNDPAVSVGIEEVSRGRESRRSMVVQADAIARILPLQTPTCCLCDTVLSNNAAAQLDEGSCATAIDRCFVDGRLVCEKCKLFFECERFVPKYHVCINPLCRRKWKQLTPKVLPTFCPSCKRHLEEGASSQQQYGAEKNLLQRMFHRWHMMCTELSDFLCFDAPKPPKTNSCDGTLHWQEALRAFHDCFVLPPSVDDVRNWNSVHGRRKHFRGVIHRCHRRFVCTVEATEELGDDLLVLKTISPGREFPVLDWFEQLVDGQRVDFIAFPNPCVTERGAVSRIVRLLKVPGGIDATAPESHSSPVRSITKLDTWDGLSLARFASPSIDNFGLGVGKPDVCNQFCLPNAGDAETEHDVGSTPALDGEAMATAGFEFGAFADLVQWSQESPPEDAHPTAQVQVSLEAALQDVTDPGLDNRAPRFAWPPCPRSPYRSPFVGGRTPMFCPRSPLQAYFGD